MSREPNLGETPRERAIRLAKEAQTNKPAAGGGNGGNGGAGETNQGKRKVKSFRYPTDTLTETSDYMQIQVVKYTPPGIGLQGGDAVNSLKIGAVFTGAANNSEVSNRKRSKEKTLAFIQLPIPAKIGDTNIASWNDGKMNAVAQFAGGFVNELMANPSGSLNPLDYLREGLTAIQNAAKGIAGNAGGLVNLGQDFLTNMAINMIPGANVSFNEFLARNRGVVVNPNMEFLFNGPSLRNFGFMYTFVPRNHKEAEEVKQIIRTFKQAMSPRSNIDAFGKDQLFGGFLQSPDVFKIRYMSGNKEHPFLNKFKFCAMTQCEVQYNGAGQGYVSYDDGTPVVITMQLAFTELTPVYHEDYDSEFGRGGVGF